MEPILIIGNITCDIIVNVNHLPKVQEDVKVESQWMQLGGCAYNVANLLHLFHFPYKLISIVGSGLYGDFIKQQLKEQGFRQRLFSMEKHGCCYCLVDQNGERSFMAYHGIEYHFKKEWMNAYKHTKFSFVYVCGLDIEEISGDAILDYLETIDCPIVFAPGPRCKTISEKRLKRMLALNPILHMNDREALQLSKKDNINEAVDTLYERVNNLVIVTLGDKGSVAKNKQECVYAKAVNCQVVDTIGAGDAHVSAMMMKLLEGKSLKEALSFANWISAKIVAKQGASFTKEEFMKIF